MIDDGLRFGEPARADDGFEDAIVEKLPAELVAEVEGIDREGAREVVERHALAFDTHESGTRLAERVLLAHEEDHESVIEGFADLLDREYGSVERRNGEFVVRETAFDPAAAAELGVPEGPKFGALADGDPVTVDGETIAPETVHTERERRFARRE